MTGVNRERVNIYKLNHLRTIEEERYYSNTNLYRLQRLMKSHGSWSIFQTLTVPA